MLDGLCIEDVLGEGDRDEAFCAPLIVNEGELGLLACLLIPRPCGRFKDWSLSTPFTAPFKLGYLCSFNVNGGPSALLPISPIVADRGGGRLSVGLLSGRKLLSSTLSGSSRLISSNFSSLPVDALSSDPSESPALDELLELFE
jgi:hypothetical protein